MPGWRGSHITSNAPLERMTHFAAPRLMDGMCELIVMDLLYGRGVACLNSYTTTACEWEGCGVSELLLHHHSVCVWEGCDGAIGGRVYGKRPPSNLL